MAENLAQTKDLHSSSADYQEQEKRVFWKLRKLRNNIRWMFLAHGTSRLLTLFVAMLAWHFLTDTFLKPPLGIRFAMLIVIFVALLILFFRSIFYPLTKRPSDEELALLVEKEYPLLNDRFITALQFSRDKERYKGVASQVMMEKVIHEGFSAAARLRFKEVVQSGRLLLSTGITTICILAFSGLLFIYGETSELWAKRLLLAAVDYPQKTMLDVQFPSTLEEYPGSQALDLNFVYEASQRRLHCAQNSGLRIIAFPRGVIPQEATLVIESERGKREESMEVAYEDDQRKKIAYFHYNIPNIFQEKQSIFIEAGDARSGPYDLYSVAAPQLTRNTHVLYDFPSYMKIPAEKQFQSRSIDAPQGTQTTLFFESDQDLSKDGARVHVYFSGAPPQTYYAKPVENQKKNKRFRFDFTLDPSMSEYEIEITRPDGIHNTERYRYDISVRQDSAPDVYLDFFGRGLKQEFQVPVTLRCELPLQYRMEDIYGLQRRSLFFRIEGQNDAAAWLEYEPFKEAYKSRDYLLENLVENATSFVDLLKGIIQRYKEEAHESSQAEAFLQNLRTLQEKRNKLEAELKQVFDIQLRLLDPATQAHWYTLQNIWVEFQETFLKELQVEAFEADKTSVIQGLERYLQDAQDLERQSEAFFQVLFTRTNDEFTLSIANLLEVADFPYRSEEQLLEAMKLRSYAPIIIEFKLEAEDYNYNPDAGRAGVSSSIPVELELMSVDELLAHISYYIRTVLKQDLNTLQESQKKLLGQMITFGQEERSLAFDEDEDDENDSRNRIEEAQLQQGSLPDEVGRLARSFTNIAQVFIFNELEADEPLKPQENRIQTVRLLLLLLAAEVKTGDTLSNVFSIVRGNQDRKSRIQGVQTMLRELDLLEPRTGVRSSFDRFSFAEILSHSDYKEAANLQRLDLSYTEILRSGARPEERYKQLHEVIIHQQKQVLAGIKVIQERLKKWEGFDAIRQEMKNLAGEQRDIHERIRDIYNNDKQ